MDFEKCLKRQQESHFQNQVSNIFVRVHTFIYS